MTLNDASVDGRWAWAKRSWARRLLLLVLLEFGPLGAVGRLCAGIESALSDRRCGGS